MQLGSRVAMGCRPAASALIRTLAWEPPYASHAALKRPKKKKKISIPFKFHEVSVHYKV